VANPFAREDDGLTGATAAAMRVAKTFQPGQNGTKGLALEFGRRLVCVRHRYDDANATRVTTVELVVDAVPLRGRAPPPRAVGEAWALTHVRLAPDERGLRRSVLAGGGRWLSEHRLWEVPRWLVARLGLHDRVVGGDTARPASAG
jgi:hypothetical protein